MASAGASASRISGADVDTAATATAMRARSPVGGRETTSIGSAYHPDVPRPETVTAAPSPPTIRDAVAAVRQRVGDEPARAVVHLRTEARMGEGTRVDLRAGAFEFAADEPASVGGTGTAPNPVQLALTALGSCQAITYRYWAEELGLRLDAVTITVEADFDTGAFFGFPGATGVPSPTAVRSR